MPSGPAALKPVLARQDLEMGLAFRSSLYQIPPLSVQPRTCTHRTALLPSPFGRCPSFIRKKADNAALLWPVSCSPLRCTALGEKEAGFFGGLDVVWLHFLLNDPRPLRMLVAAPQAACPPRAPRLCCCWVYGAFCSVWPRVTALGGRGRSCPHGAQVQTMGRPRGSMFYCEAV